MTTIFDGKKFAHALEEELHKKVLDASATPHLAVIAIGEDRASEIYLSLKKQAVERIGGIFSIYKFDDTVTDSEVLQSIEFLNNDSLVHGIMVQLPISEHLNQKTIIDAIDQYKDVDGQRENSQFIPATVLGILKIMEQAEVPEKASIVVVGESGEVGSRLVRILRDKHYSVMGTDINTQNPLEVTRMADVLVTVTGKSGLITADWVKRDAVVLDVGAPKAEVDFKEVSKKARFITPVPGGVGPVTVVSLLENLVHASLKA